MCKLNPKQIDYILRLIRIEINETREQYYLAKKNKESEIVIKTLYDKLIDFEKINEYFLNFRFIQMTVKRKINDEETDNPILRCLCDV